MGINLRDLIIIILTSIITTTFAFWKFKYEKKWEINVSAYKKIMEALYDLKKSASYFLDKIQTKEYYEQAYIAPTWQDPLKEKENDELHFKKNKNAQAIIEKVADIEAIFLGENAVNILTKLLTDFDEVAKLADKGINDDELYKEELMAIDNCIDNMRIWAKANLFNWWERVKTRRLTKQITQNPN